MASGEAKVHHAKTGHRIMFENHGKMYWSEWFHGNPKIAQRRDTDVDVLKQGGGARPYIAEKTGRKWTWLPYRPIPGEIFFTPEEVEFGVRFRGRIILEPNVKNTGHRNKDWGMNRWTELAKLLRGLPIAQMVQPGLPTLPGVEQIGTDNFRLAAAVLASAKAAVVPEGGLHHAAAAVGLRAVVIYSGFITPQVTGYDMHVNLGGQPGLGCGNRVNCSHCQQSMARIVPADVAKALRGLLDEVVQTGRMVAAGS